MLTGILIVLLVVAVIYGAHMTHDRNGLQRINAGLLVTLRSRQVAMPKAAQMINPAPREETTEYRLERERNRAMTAIVINNERLEAENADLRRNCEALRGQLARPSEIAVATDRLTELVELNEHLTRRLTEESLAHQHARLQLMRYQHGTDPCRVH